MKTMKIQRHTELNAYKSSFDAAMAIFNVSKKFPREEMYSLTDQTRRSSRSICANLAEAWRKRRYKAAFVAKLSDAEGEAAETQVWVQFTVKCAYLDREVGKSLYKTYDSPEAWVIGQRLQLRLLVPMSPCPHVLS